MRHFNEDGEPTNSISGGSMDSHEATDGGSCDDDILTRKGKKKKKKKLSKYQEYKESMDVDYNSTGWFEMPVDNETLVQKNIQNLNIAPTDYRLSKTLASFKYEEDMYNVLDLLDSDYDEEDDYGFEDEV